MFQILNFTARKMPFCPHVGYATYNGANFILVGNIELTLVILGEIEILDITA